MYEVLITYRDGKTALLKRRDKTRWRKATAERYAQDFAIAFRVKCEIRRAESC
jgi:hypothetical protein